MPACDGEVNSSQATQTLTKIPVEVATPTIQPATSVPTEEPETADQCNTSETHPIGQSIAETFEVEYEEVMKWFCEGNAFEDILLALETRDLSDVPVEVLLDKKMKGMEWEQIWQEFGLND